MEQIEKRCFYKNASFEKTIKDIYSAIVKTVYRNSSIEKHILESLQIDESEIETLYTEYKHESDTLDWKKICIF